MSKTTSKNNTRCSLIRIIIDTHEKKLHETLLNADHSFTIVEKRLEVGDISIEWSMDNIDWNVYMIIERKTYADLDSALVASSNRYREQKYRLKKLNEKIIKCYLFEGNLERYVASLLQKLRSRHEALIKGAMFNTQYRDNFQICKTESLEETANFIIKLCKKIPKYLEELGKTKTESPNEIENNCEHSELYSEKLRKKTYLDQTVCYINQLCMIPLISHKRAKAISRVFPNMDVLINQLKKKGIHTLVEIKCNDSKKIGKKASENVCTYLLGTKIIKDTESKNQEREKK